jgi:hypothetical protein
MTVSVRLFLIMLDMNRSNISGLPSVLPMVWAKLSINHMLMSPHQVSMQTKVPLLILRKFPSNTALEPMKLPTSRQNFGYEFSSLMM